MRRPRPPVPLPARPRTRSGTWHEASTNSALSHATRPHICRQVALICPEHSPSALQNPHGVWRYPTSVRSLPGSCPGLPCPSSSQSQNSFFFNQQRSKREEKSWPWNASRWETSAVDLLLSPVDSAAVGCPSSSARCRWQRPGEIDVLCARRVQVRRVLRARKNGFFRGLGHDCGRVPPVRAVPLPRGLGDWLVPKRQVCGDAITPSEEL